MVLYRGSPLKLRKSLGVCPGCGGQADNGHDRCVPPSPYYCTKCGTDPLKSEKNKEINEVFDRALRRAVKKVVDPPIMTKDGYVLPKEDWPTYKYRDIEKRRAQVREAVRRYRAKK